MNLAVLLFAATSTAAPLASASPFAADGPGQPTATALGGRVLVLTGHDTIPVPMVDFAFAHTVSPTSDLIARADTIGVFSYAEAGLRLHVGQAARLYGSVEGTLIGALGLAKDDSNRLIVSRALGFVPAAVATLRYPDTVFTFGLGFPVTVYAANFGGRGDPFSHVLLVRPQATVEWHGGWYLRAEAYAPITFDHVEPALALGHSF